MFRVLGLFELLGVLLLVGCAPPPGRASVAPAAAPLPTATATLTAMPSPTSAPTAPAVPTATHVPVITVVPVSSVGCPVTPLVRADAPPDANSDPVRAAYWHQNADQSIWASQPLEGYRFLDGDKSYWVRPRGTTLTVSGHRLDGDPAPLKTSIPCCYPTGFQIVGLEFPTKGCWAVDAKAGASELRFVTELK